MFFFDEDGGAALVAAGVDGCCDVDPFVVLAAGRSALRVGDLVALIELIAGLRRAAGPRGTVRRLCRECKGNYAAARLASRASWAA